MRCQTCQADLPPAARTCPRCGAGIGTPESEGEGGPASLDALEARLDRELSAREASLDRKLGGPARPAAASERAFRGNPDGASGGEADFAGIPDSAHALLHPQERSGLLFPSPEQIRQAGRFVFESPFIQGNPQYRSRVEAVHLEVALEDDTLNAFATDQPVELSDGRIVEPPAIFFLGGLASATRLAAAAVAAHIRGEKEGRDLFEPALFATFEEMGRAITESKGRLPRNRVAPIFETARAGLREERHVSLARSCAAAMDMFVLAHEAAHVALGHTLDQPWNYDVSRNQEREADSFASSALSTSPFREYLFLGQVFVTVLFTWASHAGGETTGTTHPLSRDRFEIAFEQNREAAREAGADFGLTRERLTRLLPPVE